MKIQTLHDYQVALTTCDELARWFSDVNKIVGEMENSMEGWEAPGHYPMLGDVAALSELLRVSWHEWLGAVEEVDPYSPLRGEKQAGGK